MTWIWFGNASSTAELGSMAERTRPTRAPNAGKYARVAVLRVFPVLCGCLCFAAPSSIAQAQSLGGIHHYELVVLGEEHESDETNMAYEITDCGLVVGQIMRVFPAVPNPSLQAFVYSTRGRPGLPAGAVTFLSTPAAQGTPSIARDANDDGWIVGSYGADSANTPTHLRRAVAWRLASDGSLIPISIDPPDVGGFLEYDDGGYGWLSAVSTGDAPWVAALFARTESCGFGPLSLQRESVAAVHLPSTADSSSITYRVLCDECPEPDVTDEGRHDARGISPNGKLLCGSRQTCGFADSCGERLGLQARNWLRDWPACSTCVPGLQCVLCRTPNPVASGDFHGAASQAAILDDGSAAGIVADEWPDLEGNDPACGERAYIWDTYDPCGSACVHQSVPPQSLGIALPLPVGLSVKHTQAFDFERSAFATQGVIAGHFVAGSLSANTTHADSQGYLWFAPLHSSGTMGEAYWEGVAASAMLSPITPGFAGVTVGELRGVNRRGDAVGSATYLPVDPAGPSQYRAVYLRAVPIACVGDLNQDGGVGSPDLAVLLGAWCRPGEFNCEALADLNVDGAVGAPYLALLLGNWGPTPCGGPCAPDVVIIPEEFAQQSKEAVDLSIALVGLTDIEGYRAWAATAPAGLRELVEEIIWRIAKAGVN